LSSMLKVHLRKTNYIHFNEQRNDEKLFRIALSWSNQRYGMMV
jgi:hypothetical protein